MIFMKEKAALIAIFFLATTFSTAHAQDRLTFDQSGTEISGRMLGSYVMLGSGEMLKGSILHLEEPITVLANKDSDDRRNRRAVKNVRTILLEFRGSSPTDDMFGGAVRLTGTLLNKPSDPFHTKVLMLVDEAALIEASDDGQPVATFKTHQ